MSETTEGVEKTEESEVGYKSKYVRTSLVKDLFVYGDQKIRISSEAKAKVYEFLDKKVEEGVKEIIGKIPTKIKGDNKGELRRITILLEDFEPKKDNEDKK